MGTHNTSNKLPTAHEMRLKAKKNQELQESRLADLPLYKECMFRLAESTGRYSRERIICGVPTNEFQDVRIERGTDASAIQQVQEMLEESGYYRTRRNTPAFWHGMDLGHQLSGAKRLLCL